MDRAAIVVGRREPAEVGDQEVEHAVTVEIGGRDVRRIRQPRHLHECRRLARGFTL